MIDTHCHILSENYENLDGIINKIKNSGVKKIIVNGCDMKSNLEVIDLVKKYDIVYGALGFHPTELENYSDECLAFLEEHINDEKIVAVGEIGLDYHYENYDKNKQQESFEKQLEIAKRHNKPIIVHSRDAIQDTYNILSKYNVRGVLHCYSGSLEMAREFIKLGFYIGIGGVITYGNAKSLVRVLEGISLDNVLLETDSPYLTPVPYRGQVNDSSYLSLIVAKIGSIKNIKTDLVVEITTRNACSLFDL